MSIEEDILVKVDLERKNRLNRNRREMARRLSERFGFVREEIEDQLINTEYIDVFGTGSVYWHYDYGHLYWYTRPKSDKRHSTHGRDLKKLVKRLERRR